MSQSINDNMLKKLPDRFFNTCSISEIEENVVVQYAGAALIFMSLVSLLQWSLRSVITENAFTQNDYICWPYFTSCGMFNSLAGMPYGYGYGIACMCCFILLTAAGYAYITKQWRLLHIVLMCVWIVRIMLVFVVSQSATAKEYFDLLFLTVYLFLPYKLFFLSFTIPFLYFTSPITNKLNDGWIIGSYFSSLSGGMPFIPTFAIPIISNLIIAQQIIGEWLLMSTHHIHQRIALLFALLFHAYSLLFVGFNFPSTMFLMLIILFGPWYKPLTIPLNHRSLYGWVFFTIIAGIQFIPILIKGEHILTKEGNAYAMYLFEANDQCISQSIAHFTDGSSKKTVNTHSMARERCDAYTSWFHIHQFCERNRDRLTKVEWTFDHSINGRPFYRIVDTQDACSLHYTAFGHNDWIRLPEEGAVMIGVPVKNYYEYMQAHYLRRRDKNRNEK